MSGRKILIGIDGVPYRLAKDYMNQGVMPNLNKISSSGDFSRVDSTVPAVSSASWSSIITGENPGNHGIYGFTQMIEGTYSLSYPNFHSLQAEPFWNKSQEKSMILNVPATYPAKEMNGMHVSGFVSPNLDKAVHPKDKLDLLKEIDYKIDIDSNKAKKSNRLLFKQLFDVLDSREKLFKKTWNEDWKNYMLVFTGSDRLEHFLWNAYDQENYPNQEKFRKYFSRVDGIIGEVFQKMKPEDKLVILSDHGMERVEKNVNLNAYLRQRGMLKLEDNGSKEKYNRIKSGSLGFALEHGRIYLNKKGNYPNGSVEDEKGAKKEIKEELKRMEYEGRKVVREVKSKEEIYSGDHTSHAPDLVALPEKGFNLRGSISDQIFEESPMQGGHDKNAFLIGHNTSGQASTVTDATKLLK